MSIEYMNVSCEGDDKKWEEVTSTPLNVNLPKVPNKWQKINRGIKIAASVILGSATAFIAKPIVDPMIPLVADVSTVETTPTPLPHIVDTTPKLWTTVDEDGNTISHTRLANGFEMRVTGHEAVEGFWEATLETLDRIERMTNGVNEEPVEKNILLDTSDHKITFAENSFYEGEYRDFALGIFKASQYGVSPEALRAFVTYYLENVGGFDEKLSNNYAQAFDLYMRAAQPESAITLADARQFAQDDSQVFEDWMGLWKNYKTAFDEHESLAVTSARQ